MLRSASCPSAVETSKNEFRFETIVRRQQTLRQISDHSISNFPEEDSTNICRVEDCWQVPCILSSCRFLSRDRSTRGDQFTAVTQDVRKIIGASSVKNSTKRRETLSGRMDAVNRGTDSPGSGERPSRNCATFVRWCLARRDTRGGIFLFSISRKSKTNFSRRSSVRCHSMRFVLASWSFCSSRSCVFSVHCFLRGSLNPYRSPLAGGVERSVKTRRSHSVAVVRDGACECAAAIRPWEHPGCFSGKKSV